MRQEFDFFFSLFPLETVKNSNGSLVVGPEELARVTNLLEYFSVRGSWVELDSGNLSWRGDYPRLFALSELCKHSMLGVPKRRIPTASDRHVVLTMMKTNGFRTDIGCNLYDRYKAFVLFSFCLLGEDRCDG